MDVRTGGAWRFVTRDPNGGETAFNGEYREVTPPERIVQTFATEGPHARVHVGTIEFQDLGDRTMVTTKLEFQTTGERDGVLEYGAERGANETYARLDALLAKFAGA